MATSVNRGAAVVSFLGGRGGLEGGKQITRQLEPEGGTQATILARI